MLDNRLPLYIQIASDLKFKINSGEWPINHQLPTEENLCEIYDVSRITIRKAFDELVKEGYVYRKRAVGTFVQERKLLKAEIKNEAPRSFSQEMTDLGRDVRTLDAVIQIVPATAKISNFLDVPEETKVMNLQRVFGAEEAPFVFFDTYFTYRKEFSTNHEDYYGSFYDYLKSFDIEMGLTKEYVEAVSPTQKLLEELPITKNSPILKRVRTAESPMTGLREYSECFYIGSEYRYYMT